MKGLRFASVRSSVRATPTALRLALRRDGASSLVLRRLATDATAAVATAPAIIGSLDIEHSSANPSFVPPPQKPLFDTADLARADGTKFYRRPVRDRTVRPFPNLLKHLGMEQPTPTAPMLKPTTLTEALRSSPLVYPNWSAKSKRVGLVGQKMGMTAHWDDWGNRLPLTVVRVTNNQILQVKNIASKKGTVGMQVGAGAKTFKHTPKSLIVHCLKAGALPKQKIVEFPVTVDAVLPLGTELSARHFTAGQWVDVTGTTTGKGFAGGMKRWGFGGQPASHGVSLTHRSIGSVGSNQSPGRVIKNKKMPGRMGAERRTFENMRIVKIDAKRNLLYIHGGLPGPRLAWLAISDAKKRGAENAKLGVPPFPTHFPKPGAAEPDEFVMATEGIDPNAELAGI